MAAASRVRTLTRDEARRIAVRGQLLDGAARPRNLLALVERLTFLQLDPTAIVAPNADLIARSRLGDRYKPAHFDRALGRDHTIFEHRAREPERAPNLAVARPMTSLGLFLGDMLALRRAPGRVNEWLKANARFQRRVLDQLRTSGPLSSRDIPDTSDFSWASSGWNDDRNVTQMLEFLASRGYVAVAGRRGKQRIWDVAERVYPTNVPVVPADEARRLRNERRLRALGVARPKAVGDAGIPVAIEGTPKVWRLDPDASAADFIGRTALLSPFDRLFHDPMSPRASELFEFDFLIEFYKPKAQRRFGYFVMPVLHGDRLIGKLDVAADRPASQLVVHATHHDVPWTRPMKAAVDAELHALAAWLGLDRVRRV
jgi:uncharacterized protein YcaQ